MTGKIFRSTLFVAILVLLVSLLMIAGCMYSYFGSVQEQQLREELDLAAAATEALGEDFLRRIDSQHSRLTWVDETGRVLYDTQADASAMENHAGREEIREALASGSGSSARFSATLTEKTLYKALRLSDGSVLRISASRSTALLLLLGMLPTILLVALLAILLSGWLARRMAKRVVEPLNTLDLEHPLENDVYEELSPLLRRIHVQNQQIHRQLRELRRKTDEFELITGSMTEGLVLLDSNGLILSINPAACRLFRSGSACVGEDFLTLDRRRDMGAAIQNAMANGHSQMREQRDGREYQFDLSRIESGGSVLGTVILAFDVTDQAEAERRRREFSANVSHELKTPLQSILGSAELLENNMVKPEDVPRFTGHIRREAARLVTLIEDIIRLSQLDEGIEAPREEVSLAPLAEEAFSALQDAARTRHVELSVTGTGTVRGVRRLLYEVIYNLCDNAIRYNTDGGSVRVEIAETEQETVLTVRDTGIGIPAEHQDRVFERFYRVDKSHSRQSGGTGLGLSIVKHAVQYHGGTVTLRSAPGQGTEITARFPRQ